MNLKSIFHIFCFTFILFVQSFAQESIRGITPKSFDFEEALSIEIPEYSIQRDEVKIEKAKSNFVQYQIGISQLVHITTSTDGKWQLLPSGDRIWQLKIKAEKSLGLNLYYSNFQIPEGAYFHVYSIDRRQIIGAYTSKNNHDSHLFSTEIIDGESCILEYFEPAQISNQNPFTIDEVVYYFRGLKSSKGNEFKQSDSCLINANCSEGDSWRNHQKSVVKVLAKNSAGAVWCTGTILNNTNQDCKPYLITANHCAEGATSNDFLQWIFYFNYETPSCITLNNEPISSTISGSQLKAQSKDGGDISSDFVLLEMNRAIPTVYQANFAGWKNTNVPTTGGIVFHHPLGDVKKISITNLPWTSSSYGGVTSNTHWRVIWKTNSTNGKSYTMGGGSGGTLLDNNGLVVGTLTGGPEANCDSILNVDFFGKMSVHWNPSGSTLASQRLKEWLDPNGSGVSSLVLKEGNTCPFVSSIQTMSYQPIVQLKFNPTNITFTSSEMVDEIILSDLSGKILLQQSNRDQSNIIVLPELSSGLYLLQFKMGEMMYTKRLFWQ